MLNVIKLLESTSPIVRGKAFLVLLEVVKNNPDMLLLCCQSRSVAGTVFRSQFGSPCSWKVKDYAQLLM